MAENTYVMPDRCSPLAAISRSCLLIRRTIVSQFGANTPIHSLKMCEDAPLQNMSEMYLSTASAKKSLHFGDVLDYRQLRSFIKVTRAVLPVRTASPVFPVPAD